MQKKLEHEKSQNPDPELLPLAKIAYKKLLTSNTLLKKNHNIKLENMKKIQKKISQNEENLITNKQKLRSASKIQNKVDKLIPILEKTKNSISKITPIQLDEIMKYPNPPQRIKMALEAICFLLEKKVLTWKEIQSRLNKGDFINSILKFDWKKIEDDDVKFLKENYLEKKEWDVKKIYGASKAVGPLGEWFEDIILYSELQKKVKPYLKKIKIANKERQKLIDEENKFKKENDELQKEIDKLKLEMDKSDKELKDFLENPDNYKKEIFFSEKKIQEVIKDEKRDIKIIKKTIEIENKVIKDEKNDIKIIEKNIEIENKKKKEDTDILDFRPENILSIIPNKENLKKDHKVEKEKPEGSKHLKTNIYYILRYPKSKSANIFNRTSYALNKKGELVFTKKNKNLKKSQIRKDINLDVFQNKNLFEKNNIQNKNPFEKNDNVKRTFYNRKIISKSANKQNNIKKNYNQRNTNQNYQQNNSYKNYNQNNTYKNYNQNNTNKSIHYNKNIIINNNYYKIDIKNQSKSERINISQNFPQPQKKVFTSKKEYNKKNKKNPLFFKYPQNNHSKSTENFIKVNHNPFSKNKQKIILNSSLKNSKSAEHLKTLRNCFNVDIKNHNDKRNIYKKSRVLLKRS